MVETQQLTDAGIVAGCRAGDPAAWNLLVERFARYVAAICTPAFRLSREDTEDVFQEVFTKAYTELDRLRDDAAIRPWIGQITRRVCIDRIRAGRDTAGEEEFADIADPEDAIADLELALDVHEAMGTLGDSCNEILDRFFARDESYRTIGEALELPSGTIASRISRCLDKLRTAMEDSDAPVRRVDG